jgi:hypothetical protein
MTPNFIFTEWTLLEIGVWMDGGSITLKCRNENGIVSSIDIVQHVILEYYPELEEIPGRIYVDEIIIEKRSQVESNLVIFLRNLEKGINLEDEIELLSTCLKFILSTEYEELSPVQKILSKSRRLQIGKRK